MGGSARITRGRPGAPWPRYLVIGLLALTITGPAAAPTPAAAEIGFASPVFHSLWERTDSPVSDGIVQRTWFWGPGPFASTRETYYSSPNQTRLVQYFDKSRMEINDPYADPSARWYVTNGLLAKELIQGQIQTGDDRFKDWGGGPAEVPVAGDPGEQNPNAPTYRTFLSVASLHNDRRAPKRTGESAGQTIDKAGNVGENLTLGQLPGAALVYYDNNLGHNVPLAFWTFMNAVGPVREGGQVASAPIVDWVFALGLPLTEPYWTRVSVGGQERDVLVQAFERRLLTFTPENPPGWQVEMGNVGQHYYLWRHGTQIPPEGARPPFPLQGPHIGYGFNVSLYYTDRNRILGLVEGAGFRWVRQQVVWSDLEASPGTYIWDELDNVVRDVHARNLHLILSVVSAPAWAALPAPPGCASHNGMPSNPADFQRLMQAMASRYFGRVDAYELWNEQNTGGETACNVDAGRYVELLKAGYTGVKAADPYAITIYGGLTPTGVMDPRLAIDDATFLEQSYQYQDGVMRNYFDVLGVHPGSNNNSPDQLWPDDPGPGTGPASCAPHCWQQDGSFYFRRVEQLRQVMERHGDAGKQVWLTEFGWTTANAAPGYEYGAQISDQLQAQYLVRAYERGRNQYPWMGVMTMWNLNFATVVPPTDEKYPWSVINGDWSPRPAYLALQAMPK